jgi:hypothetical protein
MGREAHHSSHFTTFLRRPIRHFATALRPRWMRLCCPLATAEDYRFRRRATPQFGHAASFHWSVRSREDVFTGERKSNGKGEAWHSGRAFLFSGGLV